jgi:hypothetical protein
MVVVKSGGEPVSTTASIPSMVTAIAQSLAHLGREVGNERGEPVLISHMAAPASS